MNQLPLILDNFRFANPFVLLGLLALPMLAILTTQLKSLRRPATLRYADIGLTENEASRTWRVELLPLLRWLRWIGLALLIVALARPQSGDSRRIAQGEGVDIALALDISGSMRSLDFEPDNRLVAAKAVIQDFVATREFDRVGLVVFAESAFVQAPLTVDHDVLDDLLDRVQIAPEMGLTDGTAIGMGLATAANMLKDSTAESRVLILLTDGANNSGQIDPFTAAQAANTLGIKVYTIGMGRDGNVPFREIGLNGETVITYRRSTLDEATLQRIADDTDGLYFRAQDTIGLQRIYNEINRLERSTVEVLQFNDYDEWMAWLLVPGLLILLAEMVLRHTVFRRIP